MKFLLVQNIPPFSSRSNTRNDLRRCSGVPPHFQCTVVNLIVRTTEPRSESRHTMEGGDAKTMTMPVLSTTESSDHDFFGVKYSIVHRAKTTFFSGVTSASTILP